MCERDAAYRVFCMCGLMRVIMQQAMWYATI